MRDVVSTLSSKNNLDNMHYNSVSFLFYNLLQ